MKSLVSNNCSSLITNIEFSNEFKKNYIKISNKNDCKHSITVSNAYNELCNNKL